MMILTRLEDADRYASVHTRFATALNFLRRPGIGEISSGRHAIDGDDLFVIIEKVEGRGREQARVEYHRRYIDIQFVIGGTDQIGWTPLHACGSSLEPYDPQHDVGFFADPVSTWLSLHAGSLAIFFPDDGHAPLTGSGWVHKAIVKVAVG